MSLGVNMAYGNVTGCQIGIVNDANTMVKGLQIGLVNVIANNGWAPVLPIINGNF
jgi:predicted transcriptional regulator with HTH domain